MKKVHSDSDFSSIGFVIATKRVTEEEQKICFMYREQPMDPKDSGWRLFAGDESQDYVDNAGNSGIYDPATIIAIDPSVRDLLQQPVGSAFEREDGDAEWHAAEDFVIGEGEEIEAHDLGGGWTVEIPGNFHRYEDEEGDDVFAGPGRTARIAIWDFSEKSHPEIVAMHQEFIQQREADGQAVLEYLDLSEPETARVGFVVEETEGERTYKVLYGYTIIGLVVAQGAYYYDDDDDREWALETWVSVTVEQEEP